MRVQSSLCWSGTLVLISVCVVRGKVMCDAHPGHVARVAEEVGIQREALRSRLIRQLLPTLLKKRKRGLQACAITCRYALIWNTTKWTKNDNNQLIQTTFHNTYLTVITLKVIIFVHWHHPEDLLTALKHTHTQSRSWTFSWIQLKASVKRLGNNLPQQVRWVVNRQRIWEQMSWGTEIKKTM